MTFICLEGPDEVGKTTLARLLGGPGGELKDCCRSGVYDRSWVTNWVYRLAMPYRAWTFPRQEPFVSMAHLVILLPGTRSPEQYRQVYASHGYSTREIDRVDWLYIDMAKTLQSAIAVGSMVFQSVSMLQWNPAGDLEWVLVTPQSMESAELVRSIAFNRNNNNN